MSALIVYSSLTGNTRLLAQALEKAFEGSVLMTAEAVLASPETLASHRDVFVGFWCDRGMMPEPTQKLLPLLKEKRLGIFATMGGNPESERAQAWFARQCEQFKLETGNDVLCSFLCQGKIDPALIEAMKKMPGYRETPESRARREKAALHPDRLDLENVVKIFKDAFGE